MKRIIALISAFVFAISVCVANCEAEIDAAAVPNDCFEAVEVLSALGVLQVNSADELDVSSPVTREQFSRYLYNAFSISAVETKYYFSDVGSGNKSADIIAALVANGIVSLSDSGLFRPSDPITADEAYKMVIQGLGYGQQAAAKGGFPGGYYSVARDLDIIPDRISRVLNQGSAVSILHRACMAPLPDKIETTKIFRAEPDSYIYKNLYGIEVAEGTVTAAGGVDSGDSNNTVGSESIFINGYEYVDEGNDTYEMLGSYAKVYYKEESDVRRIEHIFFPKSKNNEITVNHTQFESYDRNAIKYYNSDTRSKTQSIDLSPEAVVSCNMGIASQNISELFDNFKSGKIIARDTDRDGKYDILILKSYRSINVGIVDEKDELIYNKNVPGDCIDLSIYRTVVITDINGYDMPVGNITQNNIISFAESPNKKKAELIVSTVTVSGAVEAIENDEPAKIQIDGKEYLVAEESQSAVLAEIKIGASYTFLCNSFGEISDVSESQSGDMKYAYLIKANYNKNGWSMPALKMYTQDGKILKAVCAGRVKVDGAAKKSTEDVLTAIPDTVDDDGNYSVVPQLIRFRLDENGLISKIDTTAAGEKEGSGLLIEDKGMMHYDGVGRIGTRGMINSATVIFSIPNILTDDEKDYSVTYKPELWKQYDATLYKVDADSAYLGAIVFRTDATSSISTGSAGMYMISDISQKRDSEGEYKTYMSYLTRGTAGGVFIDEKSYNENEAIQTLTPGDIVLFGTNAAGEMNDVSVYYDYSVYKGEKPIGSAMWGAYYEDTGRCWNYSYMSAKPFLSYGYVYSKAENVLRWGYHRGEKYQEAQKTSSNVMVYDSSKKGKERVYTIPVSAVRDYLSVGMDCDSIIMHSIDYRCYDDIFIFR